MDIVVADGALLDQILGLTFDIWNEGLSTRAYGQWNTAQLRTPWGRAHLQRFALVNGGRLLATAKRYRFRARLNGHVGWMAGIGAVYTPPSERGHGYASQLIERLLDSERRDGVLLAALFSEIGSAFYERLGFSAIRLDEVTVRVERRDGAPAVLVRAGHERDLPSIAAMNESRSSSARFTLLRNPAMIYYAVAKKRLLAGLGPDGLRHVEFVVAEEGAQAVAYALLHQNANGWTLEEAGDRDPSGARLGAILQVLLAREPSAPTTLIRAWWPHAFPVPPQVTLTDRSAPRDIFMVRALADVAIPQQAADVFYWHSDYF